MLLGAGRSPRVSQEATQRLVLLASFSRRCLVERPTRTENVVVLICVQYSTTPDVRPKEGHRGDAASVLLYAIGGWWALE